MRALLKWIYLSMALHGQTELDERSAGNCTLKQWLVGFSSN